jgi:ketosteroid isomerase-like protein
MSEESMTSDLADRVRLIFEGVNRADWDAILSVYSPDAVWESVDLGTSFEGVAAIRGFFEDWQGAYAELEMEQEEIRDLGNGVTLSVIVQTARPTGSTGFVQLRYAAVATWEAGLIVRNTNYGDVDEARVAAERLADSRG